MDNIHKAKTIIVNKVLMTHEIINRLEELYSNYLVYRTIIVCDELVSLQGHLQGPYFYV